MSSSRGFFQLVQPTDLLAKLEHDHLRLHKSPGHPYPAFDFFVTAEHILDWLYPGYANEPKRRLERQDNPLLQVVSHIANGAKHMTPEGRHHTSVQATTVTVSPYGAGVYGQGPFGKGYLVVTIDPALSASLGFKMITTGGLADDVLTFWKRRPEFK